MMKKLVALIIALGFFIPLCAKTVVLYHTSDAHGFFYPQKGVGGYAALSAVLKKEPLPYLLLDSGDFANGTIETKQTKGRAAVELMNSVGYDAATIGNHEFDFKDVGFSSLLKKAKFAVLAANLREKNTDKIPTWAKAYQVFQVGSAKVAVVGLANRTPTQPTKQYYFTKPLSALATALEQIENEHPDVVVVLAHDSLADYRNGTLPYVGEIATKYGKQVHVVLGGHAHKIFQNEFINGVLFAESGCYLKNVTKIVIETDDKTGKIISAKSSLIPLQIATTGEDKEMAQKANALKVPGMEEVIGQAGADLSQRPIRKGEQDSPLDDWISDIGRQYAQTQIFIHNTGGTRITVEKGDVTRRTLIDLFPFEDKIFKMEITGRELKKFIRAGLTPWNKYVYAGLDISYTVNKKGRVKDLQVLLDGKPLENKATYTVATNSFIARNKSFKSADKQQVGTKSVRQLIEESFQKGPVFPPTTGRIIQK